MSTISIWNDQILFHWSGEVPKGCDIPLEHLRGKPDLLLAYWPIVGPHMKYSTSKGWFFLAFSQQNLKRLRDQFGDSVELKTSRHRIEKLKQDLAEFKIAAKTAMRVKEHADDSLDYKAPPLGRYQDVGTQFLVHNLSLIHI